MTTDLCFFADALQTGKSRGQTGCGHGRIARMDQIRHWGKDGGGSNKRKWSHVCRPMQLTGDETGLNAAARNYITWCPALSRRHVILSRSRDWETVQKTRLVLFRNKRRSKFIVVNGRPDYQTVTSVTFLDDSLRWLLSPQKGTG